MAMTHGDDSSRTHTPPQNLDQCEPAIAADTDEFAAFARSLRHELDPQTAIEGVLVEMAIRAAWSWLRESTGSTRAARLLERSFTRILARLERLRARRQSRWGAPVHASQAVPLAEPEAPRAKPLRVVPYHVEGQGFDLALNAGETEVDADEAAAENWRARLTFDTAISDSSPVVKGTWVTASQVVSLVVDGWSWAEILRTHPELTESDIRACLAYTVEQEDEPICVESPGDGKVAPVELRLLRC